MQPAQVGGAALSSSPWTSSGIIDLFNATSTTLTTCYQQLIATPRVASTITTTEIKASNLPVATVGGAALSPSFSRPWTSTSLSTHYTLPIPTPKCLSTTVTITPFEATNLPGFQKAACPRLPASVHVVATGSAYHGYGKPKCSYTCLIAMSLMASQSKALKTADIYKYIEQEFPYYSTLPKNNWKNSIRHSLSLGKYFRKVQSASGLPLESGKGYFWEFDPQNKATIMSEVERFLKQEGNSNVESISATPSTPRLAYNSTGPITVIPDVQFTENTSTGAYPTVAAVFQDLQTAENASPCVHPAAVSQDLQPDSSSSIQPATIVPAAVIQTAKLTESSLTCSPITHFATENPNTILTTNNSTTTEPATVTPKVNLIESSLSTTKLEPATSTAIPIASLIKSSSQPHVQLPALSSIASENSPAAATGHQKCDELQTALNSIYVEIEDDFLAQFIVNTSGFGTNVPIPADSSICNQDISAHNASPPQVDHDAFDKLLQELFERDDAYLSGAGSCIQTCHDPGSGADQMNRQNSLSECEEELKELGLQYKTEGNFVRLLNLDEFAAQSSAELVAEPPTSDSSEVVLLEEGKQTYVVDKNCEENTTPVSSTEQDVNISPDDHDQNIITRKRSLELEAESDIPSKKPRLEVPLGHYSNYFNDEDLLQLTTEDINNYINSEEFQDGLMHPQVSPVENSVPNTEPATSTAIPTASCSPINSISQLQLPASPALENSPATGLQTPDEFESAVNKISVRFEDDFLEQLIANGFEVDGTTEPSTCSHANMMDHTSEDSKPEDKLQENEPILESILGTKRAVESHYCATITTEQLMKTSTSKCQDICPHGTSPSQVDPDAYEKFLQELFDYDPMQDEAYQSGAGSYTHDLGSASAQMNHQSNPSECGEELTGEDVNLSSQNLDDKNILSRKRPLELEAESDTLSKKPRLEVPLEICTKHSNDGDMLQLTDEDIDKYIKSEEFDAFMNSQEDLLNAIAL